MQSAAHDLIVDGRSWSEFAKEHYAELWPEKKKKTEQQRRPQMFADLDDTSSQKVPLGA